MKFRIGFCVVVIAAFASPFQIAAASSSVCTDNQIISLKTRDLPTFPGDTDYCLAPPSQVPPEIKSIIESAGRVHGEVAKIFAKTAGQLLPMGVKIVLRGSDIGMLDEMTYENQITIDVFPNWQGGRFDEASYAHELGHVLVINPTPVPDILHNLGGVSIFWEQFPDFVALASYGRTHTLDQDLPPCINQAANRDFSKTSSFHMSADFFDERFLYQELQACFQAGKDGISTNADALLIQSEIQPILSDPEYPVPVPGEFNPQRCIDLNKAGTAHFLCDSHQTGIPVNSFLVNLNRDLNGRAFSAYVDALTKSSALPLLHYSCVRDTEEGRQGKKYDVDLYDYRTVFSTMRSDLSPSDQAALDKRWAESGMDVGMDFVSKEMDQSVAPSRIFGAIRSDYPNTKDFLTQPNLCSELNWCPIKCVRK